MPLLQAAADLLSNNDLVAGVIEEIIYRDDMFAMLPFVRTNGKAYVYNREDNSATNNTFGASATGLPGFIAPGSVVTEGAVTFTEIVTKLRILVGDVDVDKFLQEVESDTNDQMAIQIAAKAKAVGMQFHNAMVNGNNTTNPNQFDGLTQFSSNAQSDANQTIVAGTNGAALTLSMLDQMMDQIPLGADAFIMRRGTIRALRTLLRQSGGARPEDFIVSQFGKPQLALNGVPVLINDYLPANETVGSNSTTCSIYAARFNEVDGVHGLYGGEQAGIRIENVGTVQNMNAQRIRVKWYCGLALKGTRSLCRLSGITNI